MKKEVTPEMYNYNKFPGPEFIAFDDQVKSDTISFTLLENVKDAFDATVFGQRFTDILLKYDYIVGDWGNEQLRLRGFYKDANDIKKSSRISRLEDYIKEYCNFGCAYFVLENANPVEIKFEEERAPRRKKNNRSGKAKPKALATIEPSKAKGKAKSKSADGLKEKKQFTSKKRQETKKPKSRTEGKAKESSHNAKTGHFVIRKKEK
ncbi:YutD family protein [Streptococcus iniae]|uniref:DUF1027 domain-containing protein n=1 Tax=Streptococcus iniae TaxID=1346 RepID=A0A3L8GLW7_STRIN|nr:YutD family protein [Streptococcus iniae]AGM98332.1 hypothetical protein K710_0553 [Streptococcus iniae SF1]AHY15382.1 transcriptional regulator [Streptococcus iniae]AHY17251.1 transcriptional regulator [Streptococcus iniae]AJG25556.1 transcriptional regulator [Streptococcus iniae]APD31426.1 transcriptional regulator [Streptococcus iniae]